MDAIGGYFEIEKFNGNEYHANALKFNLVRNAFEYLVTSKKIKKVYIPFFLCDSIQNKCIELNLKYELYHIDEKFLPILNNIDKDAFIFIVNYYGLLSNEVLAEMQKIYKNIIIDNTHAFFQKPITGIDTIYSVRKFFGVPDGAYLYSDCTLNYEALDEENSYCLLEHMVGRLENNAEMFFDNFKKYSKKVEDLKVKKMSLFSQNVLKAIDYNYVLKKRIENYNYLQSELQELNLLENNIDIKDKFFMYPFFVKDAQYLRKKLIENKIFVPKLWPNSNYEFLNDIEKNYIENIIPLPIDQRYSIAEMKKIIELVKE